MSRITAKRQHRVAILAYDGLCTFEFGIAVEVFALPRPEIDVPWYDCRVCAVDDQPLRAMGGLQVSAPHGLKTLGWADTIVIPGWGGADREVPHSLCDQITKAAKKKKRIVTICSGVFLLAAAGVLKDRRATTHWRYIDQLKSAYPAIAVEQDALYVVDDNILTSAGSAAGLDLCLHIVRHDYGSKIANSVARRLVLPTHRDGGQTQYIPAPLSEKNDGLGPFLDWLQRNLEMPHTVASMAEYFGQSQRTFTRKFRNATGSSPHAWLTAERIKRARELLETTNLNGSEVAERSGFITPETFRHHFRRLVGVAPSTYRAAFHSR